MIDKRLFPFLDPGKHFVKRSWMVPGVLAGTSAVALGALAEDPPAFLFLVSICICSGAYFYLDLLCHQRKSYVVAATIASLSTLIAGGPWITSIVYPFRVWFGATALADVLEMPLPARFGFFFVVAGLAEELIKVLPVIACALVGVRLHNRFGRAFSVKSPLDGILLGAASGIGFSLAETLGEYVPRLQAEYGDQGIALYAGLAMAIHRLVGVLFSHSAWAAYFGYFVGLWAANLSRFWIAIPIGWLSAAILHALWDTVSGIPAALVLVAALSYCVVASAILEARRLHLEVTA